MKFDSKLPWIGTQISIIKEREQSSLTPNSSRLRHNYLNCYSEDFYNGTCKEVMQSS